MSENHSSTILYELLLHTLKLEGVIRDLLGTEGGSEIEGQFLPRFWSVFETGGVKAVQALFKDVTKDSSASPVLAYMQESAPVERKSPKARPSPVREVTLEDKEKMAHASTPSHSVFDENGILSSISRELKETAAIQSQDDGRSRDTFHSLTVALKSESAWTQGRLLQLRELIVELVTGYLHFPFYDAGAANADWQSKTIDVLQLAASQKIKFAWEPLPSYSLQNDRFQWCSAFQDLIPLFARCLEEASLYTFAHRASLTPIVFNLLSVLENKKEYPIESMTIIQSLKNFRRPLEYNEKGNLLYDIIDLDRSPFTDSELCSIAERMANLHLPVFRLSDRVINEYKEEYLKEDVNYVSIIEPSTSLSVSSLSSSSQPSRSLEFEPFDGVADWFVEESRSISLLYVIRIVSQTANVLSIEPSLSSSDNVWTSPTMSSHDSVLALLIEKRFGDIFSLFWNIPRLRNSLGWPFGRKSLFGELYAISYMSYFERLALGCAMEGVARNLREGVEDALDALFSKKWDLSDTGFDEYRISSDKNRDITFGVYAVKESTSTSTPILRYFSFSFSGKGAYYGSKSDFQRGKKPKSEFSLRGMRLHCGHYSPGTPYEDLGYSSKCVVFLRFNEPSSKGQQVLRLHFKNQRTVTSLALLLLASGAFSTKPSDDKPNISFGDVLHWFYIVI